MKKTIICSSLSTSVVHLKPSAGSSSVSRVSKTVAQVSQASIEANATRARYLAAIGDTSSAALQAQPLDDPAPSGEQDGDWVDEPPADDAPPAYAVHPFLPFIQYMRPGVPIKRYDSRTRREHIMAREAVWSGLMPPLVDTLLAYRDGDSTVSQPLDTDPRSVEHEETEAVEHEEAMASAPAADPTEVPAVYWLEVSVLYEKCFVAKHRISLSADDSPAVALLRDGLVACTPQAPSLAVSVDLLEFYYRLRRHAPRLGVQQFVKAICDRHERPFRPYLREQFALAFDVYLAILRQIDTRVKIVLGRSEPHWRVRNACPPCRNKLVGEPDLIIPGFIAMDCNSSLKRIAAAGSADPRVFESDYLIADKNIDLYENEVKRRVRVTRVPKDGSSDDVSTEVLEEPGEPGDDAPTVSLCAKRWKASKAEHQKVAPDMFEQTGIYALVCPHGLVLWYAEMRRSGELAKYPLGALARVLEAGLAPIHAASDIGCALEGTLSRSSLGGRANDMGLKICMNAFHCYGHNRLCQLKRHPLYMKGFGLEDVETCERLFSASNNVGGIVRHASHFTYSQFIDMFFAAWDDEKYAELSRFIYNNVIQARRIIEENGPLLEAFKARTGFTDADIEGWRANEERHLESLKDEPARDVLCIDYVEALQELDTANDAANRARMSLQSDGFVVFEAEDLTGKSYGEVMKRNTRRRATHDSLKAANANVATLEIALNIGAHRWTPDRPEYQATLRKMARREYMRAVDRLEFLMLQRMAELKKTHTLGTSYKMREHIGKNIKARSKAIATAVKKYNTAALALTPPGPTVEFAQLLEWTELQEFDLLRLSRDGDVRERAWAQPANREAAVKHYKLQRAREELTRCRVEMRRLVTAIDSETKALAKRHDELSEQRHALAREVGRLRDRRAAANALHLRRLSKLAAFPDFAEAFTPGTPVASARGPAQDTGHDGGPHTPTGVDTRDPLSDEEDDMDEMEAERYGFLEDQLANLDLTD